MYYKIIIVSLHAYFCFISKLLALLIYDMICQRVMKEQNNESIDNIFV